MPLSVFLLSHIRKIILNTRSYCSNPLLINTTTINCSSPLGLLCLLAVSKFIKENHHGHIQMKALSPPPQPPVFWTND